MSIRALTPRAEAGVAETLRSWLEQAERGEITGVVLLGNRPGQEIQHGWAGHVPSDRIVYGLHRLIHKFVADDS